jgi:hypothetical protein
MNGIEDMIKRQWGAAKSSHDPHGLAQDAIANPAVNAVARDNVYFDAEPTADDEWRQDQSG